MSEGYNNVPTHILYPERRIICRQHVIDKSAGSYRHRMPTAVENLDPATLEIADKQPRPLRGLHNGNSLVDGLSRMVHLQNGVVEINRRIPSRYRAILRHEDKESLRPWLYVERDCEVEYVSGRRRRAALPARDWDRDHKTLWRTTRIIEGGKTSAIVRNPPGRRGGTRQTPCVHQVGIKVRDTGNTRRISSQIRAIEVLPESAAGDEHQTNRERNGERRALSFHRLAHWRFLAFEIQPVTLNAFPRRIVLPKTGIACRQMVTELSADCHFCRRLQGQSVVFIVGAPQRDSCGVFCCRGKYWSAWHLNLRVRPSLAFTIFSTGATVQLTKKPSRANRAWQL